VKADRNVKKFGGGHILRWIYGKQNSAANSARRKFSTGFSTDKYSAVNSAIVGG